MLITSKKEFDMFLLGPIYKIYSWQHFLLVGILLALMALGIFLIIKKIKTDKSRYIFFAILSGISLALLIAGRISHIYHNIQDKTMVECWGEQRPYNWFMLLPDSFCSIVSLVSPIIIICKKYKNNKFLEATYVIPFLGMASNLIYPEYLSRLPFWEFRTWFAVIYHAIMGYLIIALMITKDIKPKLKNWYYMPIAIAFFITLGMFELTCLHFCEAFNLTHHLVEGNIITSWYFICLGYILSDLLVRLVYFLVERHQNKNKVEKIEENT